MQREIRQAIIQALWQDYYDANSQIQQIDQRLRGQNIRPLALDHFAIIDLPGPHSGIPQLQSLFEAIGFSKRGHGCLPEKQNDFTWMAEQNSHLQPAKETLPQVVVADFRLVEMPATIRAIIEKYSHQATAPDISRIQKETHVEKICAYFTHYLRGREWPLPTVSEFETVREFNELLAWVLVFGRRPNHFTLSVHLMSHFENLQAFHHFIEHDVKLPLNQDGGILKGGPHTGIAQGSTAGIIQPVQLQDGIVFLPTGFVEFVWRYPRNDVTTPTAWNDYFTGFVAQHANHVIESLYVG